MKVLVADDDPGVRRGLAAQIRADNFDVVTCGDAEQTLAELTSEDPPAIAIIDWVLPDRTGVDICRALRDRNGEAAPYIIMLTVKKEATFIAEALDAGANDYVTKPFSMMELRARIRVGRRVVELQDALRHKVIEAQAAAKEVRQLDALLPVCCYCRKVRDDDDYWHELEAYLGRRVNTRFSHGICPACVAQLNDDGSIATKGGHPDR
jgi:DNA-binding response OmpR family regulator